MSVREGNIKLLPETVTYIAGFTSEKKAATIFKTRLSLKVVAARGLGTL